MATPEPKAEARVSKAAAIPEWATSNDLPRVSQLLGCRGADAGIDVQVGRLVFR
jgi:hypothetical protein